MLDFGLKERELLYGQENDTDLQLLGLYNRL